MARLKAFRSSAAWAACFSLFLAAWLTLSPSAFAQESAGDPPAPAEVAPAQADEQPTADAPTIADEPPAETKPDNSKPDETNPEAAPADEKPIEPPANQPANEAKSDAPAAATPEKPAAETKSPEATPPDEKPAPAPAAPKAPATPSAADAGETLRVPADVSSIPVEQRFHIVDAMRNQDDQITPAEYTQARKQDADLTPQKEFADLDIDNNQSLTLDEFAAGFDNLWILAAIILATFVLPFVAAIYICRAIRLPEYATRLGFVLLAVAGSIVVVTLGHLRYGIDLKGGVILVYEVDKEKTEQLSSDDSDPEGDYMDRLIAALNLRVNPGGQKEIVIRKFGEREVEIIVPEAQPAEIEQLKKTIRTAGFLEFRIMANRRNLRDAFPSVDDVEQLIKDLQASTNERDVQTDVYDSQTGQDKKVTVARWFPVDTTQVNLEHETQPNALILRKNSEGLYEALTILRKPFQEDELVVHGSQLSSAGSERDPEGGGIAVTFRMSTIGAANLGAMTGQYGPLDERRFLHRMGIVFDGKLISAPGLKEPISERVMITGEYTKQDVASMVNVLNAGSLPAVLNENPVSQNEIGATVGEDTIRKGRISIIASTLLVLAFMAAFYRFSGLVACAALMLNVLITFAVIILFKAPLTLPGLAGLALGVGMAVDANVLIFERIREELDRGAALRMAIRNGFDRASITIIDSNLTTVITGLVLYWIGTDQVKGFAVTLIVGIVANLFTAITASRLVFDIADKKRLLSKLTMSRLVSGTNFDFIGKRRLCIGASVVLIAVGLAAAFSRGVTMLDIDFAGGTSAEVVFEDEKNIDEIRKLLAEKRVPDATVSRIMREDGRSIQFKIDTSLGNESSLTTEFQDRDVDGDGKLSMAEYVAGRTGQIEEFATNRFAQLDSDGNDSIEPNEFEIELEDVLHFYLEYVFDGQLKHNSLTNSAPTSTEGASAASGGLRPLESPIAKAMPAARPSPRASSIRLASYQAEPAEGAADTQPEDAAAQDDAAGNPATGNPPPTEPAGPQPEDSKPEEPANGNDAATPAANDASDPPAERVPSADDAATPMPDDSAADATMPPTTPPTTAEPAAPTTTAMQTAMTLTFAERLPYKQVQSALELIVKERFPSARFRVTNADAPGSQEAHDEWVFESTLSPDEAKTVVEAYAAKLAGEPVFPARNHIGAAVADKAKQQAVLAIAVSLVAIIVYVWIRFQKVAYGLAAVVALAHDVLVALALLGLSSYFVSAVPAVASALQIESFKINLNVVAAFMTIIGFSINDTIVIFDRVRELRGKSPYLTAGMVNTSVNQMLGRTLLTSGTLLLVIGVLYFFGGEAIHGFAFTMLIGVLAGVYSTVYIATPFVLWMAGKPQPVKPEVRSPAQVA